MLAATYAKRIGRAVAFSLAAFRQAFAGGRDLGDTDTVLIAAAACEMHPAAVLKALELRSVAERSERANERARRRASHRCRRFRSASACCRRLERRVEGQPRVRADRLRDTREPAFLADPRRLDRIEVVSIDDGEVVLFWELPAKEATKLTWQLREDLVALEADEFVAVWSER